MSAALPEEVRQFVREAIGEDCELLPLLGDASTRGYYRISTADGRRYMLAYYPEAVRPDVARFLRAYEAISGSARVPAVHHRGSAAVVQEDVGDETLFDIIRKDRDRGLGLYRAAIDLLVAFQMSPPTARSLNPPFDVAKFSEELEMSRKYFVEELAGQRSQTVDQQLREGFDRLSRRLVQHPYVLCHRDYHGQNIHVVNSDLYMIDYQDMRMGPDTYDLASLLRDRGMARVLGRDHEEALVEHYRALIQAGSDLGVRYLETLLQRSIKVLGTFSYQAVVRKRMHYLDFIPPALESVRFCLEGLPEFSELEEMFPLTFKPPDS